jgi:hypothetical protein
LSLAAAQREAEQLGWHSSRSSDSSVSAAWLSASWRLLVPLRSIDGPEARHLPQSLAGVIEPTDLNTGCANRLGPKERLVVVLHVFSRRMTSSKS